MSDSPRDPSLSDADANAPEMWFDSAATLTKQRYTGESPREQHSEWQILQRVRAKRRLPRALWLIPMLALLGGSLAWAKEVRTALSWAAYNFASWISAEQNPVMEHTGNTPAESAPGSALRSGAELSHAPNTPAEVSAPESEVSARPTNSLLPKTNGFGNPVRKRELEPASSATDLPEKVAEAAASLSDVELYKAAHQAHFAERNWALALQAWDRYLAEAHKGQFMPEARYNRGLALAELGRRREAVQALTPFAQGAYGSYRQAEARARIRQLQAPP